MTNQNQPTVQLRSLLFQLQQIERIEHMEEWYADAPSTTHHALLLCLQGQGSLQVEQDIYSFTPDKCYWLPAGSSVKLNNTYRYDSSGFRFYRITFSIVQVSEQLPSMYTDKLIPGRLEVTAYPFSRLLRMADTLFEESHCPHDLDWYRQQLRFQEIIGLLLEHNLHSEHVVSSTQALENTIQYMNNHYMDSITVKDLAQLANMTSWKYTPMFQKLTGKKPLNYLTEVRINRSKELLAATQNPLRMIARQVGFTDEYYFNRRFRQVTGITPKQYALIMRRRTRVKDWIGHEVDIPTEPKRIIYHGETFGDLLALGVQAIGCDLFAVQPEQYQQYQHDYKDIKDIGFPINLDKAAELKPDLIIVASSDEEQYQRISQIAPTVTFNSFAPLDQRLHTLGKLLDKKHEAEQWLGAYHMKAAAMWRQLRTTIKPGETASVFIYDHGHHLFVMGTSGLSSVLYDPCGFQPVDKIQELLDEGQGFIEIDEARIADYAGDRIFMLMSSNPKSRLATKQLMTTPLWHRLPAVKEGKLHIIEAKQWNYGDAMTRIKLLDELPHLLTAHSG